MKAQRLQVYRNLNNKMLSVRDSRTRLVLGHSSQIHLTDIRFHVMAAGNARAREEKRKNVHAWVSGIRSKWSTPPEECLRATYNPYLHQNFVLKDTEEAVHQAREAWIKADGTILILP